MRHATYKCQNCIGLLQASAPWPIDGISFFSTNVGKGDKEMGIAVDEHISGSLWNAWFARQTTVDLSSSHMF
jgi:hypothetical protein